MPAACAATAFVGRCRRLWATLSNHYSSRDVVLVRADVDRQPHAAGSAGGGDTYRSHDMLESLRVKQFTNIFSRM